MDPVRFGAGLYGFLNSQFGTLIIGSGVAALGLFTWQRWDWVYKERYYRTQVMVDRRIKIVEQVNNEVGHLLAHADNVIAAFEKQVPDTQKNTEIDGYNKQETQWFGTYLSFQAPLGFYFTRADVSAKFIKILDATKELDGQIYLMTTGGQEPGKAHEVSTSVRHTLQVWSHSALQNLFSAEK